MLFIIINKEEARKFNLNNYKLDYFNQLETNILYQNK